MCNVGGMNTFVNLKLKTCLPVLSIQSLPLDTYVSSVVEMRNQTCGKQTLGLCAPV